jgi:hypothetical protein
MLAIFSQCVCVCVCVCACARVYVCMYVYRIRQMYPLKFEISGVSSDHDLLCICTSIQPSKTYAYESPLRRFVIKERQAMILIFIYYYVRRFNTNVFFQALRNIFSSSLKINLLVAYILGPDWDHVLRINTARQTEAFTTHKWRQAVPSQNSYI